MAVKIKNKRKTKKMEESNPRQTAKKLIQGNFSNFMRTSSFKSRNLIIFLAVFCPIAVYILIRSFAATPNALQGDINGDSTVNTIDLSILLSNYGKTASQSTNSFADINADGNISVLDLSILLSNYGKTSTTSTPAIPTNVKATAGNAQVTITWNANTETNLAYYAVRRSTDPNADPTTWTRLATNYTTPTATDTGLSNGTTYYYYVTAVNNNNVISDRSSVVSATPQGTTTPPPPPPPPSGTPVLPKQGISTGYKIINRSSTDRAFELDKIKRIFNGKPGYVRVDSNSGNQTQLSAVITDILSRGMTPMIVLYGTTNPRSVDTFGHDQAVKWLGKVSFFEVANEPDLHGWTPDGYADFVKGTYSSIKSGNPNAVVIAGALWKGTSSSTTPQSFANSLATRAKGSFNMLSMHLYDDPKTRANWNIWDMAFPTLFGANSSFKGNTVREILNTNGLSSVPIISTETGGTINTYGESGQNTIVAHDFDALNANLLPSMAVYSMMDDDVPGFGMLRPDKTERPAFATFMSRAY
jgi:hypothetical protein